MFAGSKSRHFMAALGTVLIAEDNPDDALLLERALRGAGVRDPVVVVRDGVEAVDYLVSCWERGSPESFPALALLDVGLPRLGGLGVLAWLNEQTAFRRKMAVVMVAAAGLAKEKEAAWLLGADGYIEKPVRFELLGAVMRLARERLQREQGK